MISILCSTYNSSKYIDKYLTYLNEQFLPEFEVIFVDAASTDDSLTKIIDFEFREGIKKQVFTFDTKISIYEAWNHAIKHSSYDYVMNYNTDDRLLPSALSTMEEYSRLYPEASVIYSKYCGICTEDSLDQIGNLYQWNDAGGPIQNLLNGCCCGPCPLLKKSAIVDEGMFDPSFTISGDYEMWCRLRSRGHIIKRVDELTCIYYNNPEGVSTTPTQKRLQEHVAQDTFIRQRYA